MTTLAEAVPVAVDFAGSSADELDDAVAFPAWSTLSWEERADFVARYCL